MKKLLLFTVMTFAAFAANADIETTSTVATVSDEIVCDANSCTISYKPIAVPAATNRNNVLKAENDDISGFYQLASVVYYGSKYSDYNDKVQHAEQIEIVKDGDGYLVKGFFQPFTSTPVNALKATYADTKLTIPAGQELYTSGDGKVILAHPSDYFTGEYVANDIVFEFIPGTDEFIETSGSGLARGIPEYDSGNVFYTPYLSTATVVMRKCNATIKQYNEKDEVIYDGHACVIPDKGDYQVWGYFNTVFTGTVSEGDFTVEQSPSNFSTSKYSSGYGFGYPCKALYKEADGKWYFYTSTETSTGLDLVTGTITANDNSGEIVLGGSTIMALNSSGSGGLRFGDYTSKTEIAWSDTPSAIDDVNTDKAAAVKNVEYVDIVGHVSSTPFEGVNIVVTNYTDGSRKTTKILKK